MSDPKTKPQSKPQSKPAFFSGNNRQITRDCFYMTIVSLYQREPDSFVATNTDIDDFEITAVYDPSEKYGNLPLFSDFVIHHKKDSSFEVPLKKYKDRYMEFRNLILDMVAKKKEEQKKQLELEESEK